MLQFKNIIGPGSKEIYRTLLLAWTALIFSASLYPFDWNLILFINSTSSGLPKLMHWQNPSQRDAIVNLLLYTPFGFLGYLAFKRLLIPIIGAIILAFIVEVMQHALLPRDPSLADWLLNVIGALFGALISIYYRKLVIKPISIKITALDITPIESLLLALWISAHCAPFVPRLRPGRITAALIESFEISVQSSLIAGYFACYIILLSLVRKNLPVKFFLVWFLIILASSLVIRLLFIEQHLSLNEIYGALLTLPFAGYNLNTNITTIHKKFFKLACVGLLLAGLIPLFFNFQARPFIWQPFWELTMEIQDPHSLPIMERIFLLLGITWLSVHLSVGNKYFTKALGFLIPAFIILSYEFLQQWSLVRIPDTTDIVILLISAALVHTASKFGGIISR